MKKKISVLALLIAFAAISVPIWKNKTNQPNDSYTLGKTPYSYQCTFGKDFFLYKWDAWKNGKKEFSGLYIYDLNQNKEYLSTGVLLSNSFSYYINIYKDSAIFRNTNNEFEQVNLENRESTILYSNPNSTLKDSLVINDILYFIEESKENVFCLMALNLIDGTVKELAQDIDSFYLYHNREDIIVKSSDCHSFIQCNAAEGIVAEYPSPEDEIIGFLDDGRIILSKDNHIIYQLDDLEGGSQKILLEMEDIYRLILHSDELLICTFSDYGLIQIHIYDFASGQITKIANANMLPQDFDDSYIFCCSDEGIALPEIIDRKTGKISVIRKSR